MRNGPSPRLFLRAFAFGLLLCAAAACAEQAPASVPTAPPTAVAQATDQPTARPIQPTEGLQLATAVTTLAAPQAAAPPAIAAPSALPPFPTRAIGDDTLGQLALLRTVGYGGAQSAAIAPDGQLLAVGTTAGLALFDLPGLRSLRFDPVEGGVDEIAFSPDAATIAFYNRKRADAATRLRHVADDRVLEQLWGVP